MCTKRLKLKKPKTDLLDHIHTSLKQDAMGDCIGNAERRTKKSLPSLDFELLSPITAPDPSIFKIFLLCSILCLSFRLPSWIPSWLHGHTTRIIAIFVAVYYLWSLRYTLSNRKYASYIEIFPHGIQLSEKTIYIHGQSTTVIHGHVQFIPMDYIIDVILVEQILTYKVVDCVMLRIKSYVDDRNIKIQLIPVVSCYRIPLSRDNCVTLLRGLRDALTVYHRPTHYEPNINNTTFLQRINS
jgi:hypothetical protein